MVGGKLPSNKTVRLNGDNILQTACIYKMAGGWTAQVVTRCGSGFDRRAWHWDPRDLTAGVLNELVEQAAEQLSRALLECEGVQLELELGPLATEE